MQSELITRQKQTIAELTRAKESLTQINEELTAINEETTTKLEKHVQIHKIQKTNKHEGSLRFMPNKVNLGG